jgi:hypothetical protein
MARKMTSDEGDQRLPFEEAARALRAAPSVPDRVLLSDIIDAATMLTLGDDSGLGQATRDALRAEIVAASEMLGERWTEQSG